MSVRVDTLRTPAVPPAPAIPPAVPLDEGLPPAPGPGWLPATPDPFAGRPTAPLRWDVVRYGAVAALQDPDWPPDPEGRPCYRMHVRLDGRPAVLAFHLRVPGADSPSQAARAAAALRARLGPRTLRLLLLVLAYLAAAPHPPAVLPRAAVARVLGGARGCGSRDRGLEEIALLGALEVSLTRPGRPVRPRPLLQLAVARRPGGAWQLHVRDAAPETGGSGRGRLPGRALFEGDRDASGALAMAVRLSFQRAAARAPRASLRPRSILASGRDLEALDRRRRGELAERFLGWAVAQGEGGWVPEALIPPGLPAGWAPGVGLSDAEWQRFLDAPFWFAAGPLAWGGAAGAPALAEPQPALTAAGLEALLRRGGWTQKALADAAGIGAKALNHYLRGRHPIPPAVAAALEAAARREASGGRRETARVRLARELAARPGPLERARRQRAEAAAAGGFAGGTGGSAVATFN